MRLRFVLLLSLASVACSSEESPPPASGGVDQCTRTGGSCAPNFPFLCAGGFVEATDDARKTACGMSIGENPRPVKCCLRVTTPPQDTGVADTATSDASTDTSSDGSSTDAPTSDGAGTDAMQSDATADGG